MSLMFLTSGQKRNAFVYKRMCLWVDVECHHEQRLHTMCSVQDAYTTYTCTMSRVQLRSTEETCSIKSPCACKCVCVGGGGGGVRLHPDISPCAYMCGITIIRI